VFNSVEGAQISSDLDEQRVLRKIERREDLGDVGDVGDDGTFERPALADGNVLLLELLALLVLLMRTMRFSSGAANS
jgi:hypothetical protein